MKLLAAFLLAGTACLLTAQSQEAANPFLGRWDFTIAPERANWLGVTAKDGALEIWFQPTGGNVYQVKDFKPAGSHLTLNLQRADAKNPALIWELDAAGDQLTGLQKRGADQIQLTGVRAPELKRASPAAWTPPRAALQRPGPDRLGAARRRQQSLERALGRTGQRRARS